MDLGSAGIYTQGQPSVYKEMHLYSREKSSSSSSSDRFRWQKCQRKENNTWYRREGVQRQAIALTWLYSRRFQGSVPSSWQCVRGQRVQRRGQQPGALRDKEGRCLLDKTPVRLRRNLRLWQCRPWRQLKIDSSQMQCLLKTANRRHCLSKSWSVQEPALAKKPWKTNASDRRLQKTVWFPLRVLKTKSHGQRPLTVSRRRIWEVPCPFCPLHPRTVSRRRQCLVKCRTSLWGFSPRLSSSDTTGRTKAARSSWQSTARFTMSHQEKDFMHQVCTGYFSLRSEAIIWSVTLLHVWMVRGKKKKKYSKTCQACYTYVNFIILELITLYYTPCSCG